MREQRSYFEQAADALRQAFAAEDWDVQALALDKALRLNGLAVADEQAKAAQWVSIPSRRVPPAT